MKIKFIMYNVHDFRVLYNTAVRAVGCKRWLSFYPHKETLASPHHVTKRGGLGP